MADDMLIEGYAAVFGEPDQMGDVVRAGAFARSLSSAAGRPMLLQHGQGKVAGRWVRMVEDQRGLYVRGLIEGNRPSGAAALALVRASRLDGLSIGFHARAWTPRTVGGRELRAIDLVEVSLVAEPMAPKARFAAMNGRQRAA